MAEIEKINKTFECYETLEAEELNNIINLGNNIVDYIKEHESSWGNGGGGGDSILILPNLNDGVQIASFRINNGATLYLYAPKGEGELSQSGTSTLFAFAGFANDDLAEESWNNIRTRSNYPPSGWSKSSNVELGNEDMLYMTTALKQGTEFVVTTDGSIWQHPVRIGSGNTTSTTGVDDENYNYIYCRTITENEPNLEGSGTNKGVAIFNKIELDTDKEHGYKSSTDEDGIDIINATNQEIDGAWTDHPHGISEEFPNEWLVGFKRIQINETLSEWRYYFGPICISHWGETGLDGDGFEYIFKSFPTELTFGNNDNNPAHWDAVQQDDYFGPDGHKWSDDSEGVDSENKFEYVSTRKKNNQEWGKYRIPKLWAQFVPPGTQGLNGSYHLWAYLNSIDQPDTPESNSDYPPDGWSIIATTPDFESGEYTWCTERTITFDINNNPIYGLWCEPYRITGNNGKPGEDGDTIEFIYRRFKTEQTFENNDLNPTYWEISDDPDYLGKEFITTESDSPDNKWTDNPRGVSDVYLYEYVSQREYTYSINPENGEREPKSWSKFTPPAIWSKWGEKGMDGDGYEYIFYLSNSAEDPTIADSDGRYSGSVTENGSTLTYNSVEINSEGYQRDDFIPNNWYDEPQTVNNYYPRQYVSVRKKRDDVWGGFSDPKLWNVYATNGLLATLTNDNILLDDDTNANAIEHVSLTKVFLWDGANEVTFDTNSYKKVTVTIGTVGFDSELIPGLVTEINNGDITISNDYKGWNTEIPILWIDHNINLSNNYKGFALTKKVNSNNKLNQKSGSIIYTVKAYANASDENPTVQVSRYLTLLVLDINDGTAYLLSVTPNTLGVYRTDSNSNYQFRDSDTINVSVTAFSGNNATSIPIKKEGDNTITSGDLYIKIKNSSGQSLSLSDTDITSGAENSLNYKLSVLSESLLSDSLKYIVVDLYYRYNGEDFKVDSETVDFSIKGDDGVRGSFKSRVFCRTNYDIGSDTYKPIGGSYDDPYPTNTYDIDGESVTWSDGIPPGNKAIWSSVCTFYDNNTSSEWSIPVKESDTADLDIEFSPIDSSTAPDAPLKSTPSDNKSDDNWYDPTQDQTLPGGVTWESMIWRAERKVRNGAYVGDWVITRIKGEKGDSTSENYVVNTTNDNAVIDDLTTDLDALKEATLNIFTVLRGTDITNECTFIPKNITLPENLKLYTYTYSNNTISLDPVVEEENHEYNNINGFVLLHIGEEKINSGNYYYDIEVHHNDELIATKRFKLYVDANISSDGSFYKLNISKNYFYFDEEGNCTDENGSEITVYKINLNGTPELLEFDIVNDISNVNNIDLNKLYLEVGNLKDNDNNDDNDIIVYDNDSKKATIKNDKIEYNGSGYNITLYLGSALRDGPQHINCKKISGGIIRLTLDNDHEDFLYNDAGTLIAPSNGATSQIRLYDGITEIKDFTPEISTVEGTTNDENGAYIDNDNILHVKKLTEPSCKVTIEASYNGVTVYTTFTAKKTSLDKYDLKLSPNPIIYNPDTSTNLSRTIDVKVFRTDLLNNVTKLEFGDGGSYDNISSINNYGLIRLYAEIRYTSGSGNTYGQKESNPTINVSEVNKITFTLKKYKTVHSREEEGQILDTETIEIIKVENGQEGPAGNGISGVTEWYYASANSSGITYDSDNGTSITLKWKNDPSLVGLSSINKYLWNYEEISYTKTSSTNTTPAIIGVYGENGRGISSIKEYYLASTESTGITTSSTGWTDNPTNAAAQLTSTKKYLWNYEKIIYTVGLPENTTPVIIGVYGDVIFTALAFQLFRGSSNITLPSMTSGITQSTTDFGNGWWNVPLLPRVDIGSYESSIDECPFDTNYEYSISQQIYCREDIGNVSKIRSITFYNSSSSLISAERNISIYMRNTEKTVFDDEYDGVAMTSDDLVFSGVVVFFSGTNTSTTIKFSKIFDYAGKNVILTIVDNTGSYISDSIKFDRFNNGSIKEVTIYNRRDSSSFNVASPSSWNAETSAYRNRIRFEVEGTEWITYVSTAIIMNGTVQGSWSNPIPWLGGNGESASDVNPNILLDTEKFKNTDVWFNLNGQNQGLLDGRVVRYANSTIHASQYYPSDASYLRLAEQSLGGGDETLKLSANTWYTFSAYFKGDAKAAMLLLQAGGYADKYFYFDGVKMTFNRSSLTQDLMHQFDLTNEWTRHTLTFKVKESITTTYMLYAGIRMQNAANTNKTINIAMMKLERGMVATAYMPNENDLVGATGNTGKFYYYAGVWNDLSSSDTFLVSPAQTPYFQYRTTDNQLNYWVFVADWQTGQYTKAQLGIPLPSDSNWQKMTNDFKYIITEAIFGKYAHFGSAIINGDWMLSQHGTLYDTSDTAHVIDDTYSWSTYNINNAYTYFNASCPDSSEPSKVNFCPNYAVNLKTGKVYLNDAVVRGSVVGVSGTFNLLLSSDNKVGLIGSPTQGDLYWRGLAISNNPTGTSPTDYATIGARFNDSSTYGRIVLTNNGNITFEADGSTGKLDTNIVQSRVYMGGSSASSDSTSINLTNYNTSFIITTSSSNVNINLPEVDPAHSGFMFYIFRIYSGITYVKDNNNNPVCEVTKGNMRIVYTNGSAWYG